MAASVSDSLSDLDSLLVFISWKLAYSISIALSTPTLFYTFLTFLNKNISKKSIF